MLYALKKSGVLLKWSVLDASVIGTRVSAITNIHVPVCCMFDQYQCYKCTCTCTSHVVLLSKSRMFCSATTTFMLSLLCTAFNKLKELVERKGIVNLFLKIPLF